MSRFLLSVPIRAHPWLSSSSVPIRAHPWLLLCSLLFLLPAAAAGQREGCHIEEIVDEDGDLQVQMESEWINMYIQPSIGSTVVRFVFRPTGNDILDEIQPKFLQHGGGLLQDNFWEQDWRYSEFRGKFYDYKIIKNTKEEVAATFETRSVGYLEAEGSGVISKLLSNVRIRRTVRLKAGAPYFLFDLELINEDQNAKLPFMWVHNSSIVDPQLGDAVDRPSARGVRRIGGLNRAHTPETQRHEDPYIWDFNEGWSARISPARKEGLVYLMDYDYLRFLYNCGNTTSEWVYDNVLVLKNRPWKGRTYILPVMGLSGVSYADEYFIVQVEPRRGRDRLDVVFRATASYRPVKRITFNTELEYGHLKVKRTRRLDPAAVEDLGVAPVEGTVAVENPPEEPFLLNVTAHVELPDGAIEKREFQCFHLGSYKEGDNVGPDGATVLAPLRRPLQKPFIPEPPEGLRIDRGAWRVFGVLGNFSRRLGLREAVRSIPAQMGDQDDIGYTYGFAQLTDFAFDYERLFKYRVVLLANSQQDVIRRVGATILANYLQRGGGLVLTGGDSAFRFKFQDPPHELDGYIPIEAAPEGGLLKKTVQLNSPVAAHPIFRGIDLANFPYLYYYHNVKPRADLPSRVLMKAGEAPFIVELSREDTRVVAVLCVPFGEEKLNPGKTPLWRWDQWPKLLANIVKYAGHGP